MSYFDYLFDKLWAVLVAVVVTQWAVQKLIEVRKPRLKMVPEVVYVGIWRRLDTPNTPFQTTVTTPGYSGISANATPPIRGLSGYRDIPCEDIISERPYHAWRVKVQHIKISSKLAWLIKGREPALHCKAYLTFYESNGDQKFIMQGRWANTPEPSRVFNMKEKIIYPDTIDIGYHDDEPTILDCLLKFDDEKVTYAWNNESYAYNGKTPTRKFEVGTYRVDVKLSGPNVRGFTTKFDIVISEDWRETSLQLAKGQRSG
jgi:hypothetical protein